MTDSEEVEKVLQSLEGESGGFEAASGDPDRDKVEELLRQLEQEKENENIGDDAVQANDKPKLTSRVTAKKPNGTLKVGDKPAAPAKKSPPRDEIPKPWKKKGAIRKKPEGDEDFFVVSAKDPPPTLRETSKVDAESSPTGDSEILLDVTNSPSVRAQTSSASLPHDGPNGVYTPASPSPSPAPASPSPQNGHTMAHLTAPQSPSPIPQAASPSPVSPIPPHTSSSISSPSLRTASPVPKSTTPPPSITLTASTPPLPHRTVHESESITKHAHSTEIPTKQQPAEDMLIDDSIKYDERVFSKADFENLRNQILQQVSEETAILAQEFQELKLKYDEEVRGKTKLKSVLAEYEKTIAKLIDEAGMSGHHEGLAERVIELENEGKRKTEEYEAIALAHSELKSRYEATKTDNEKLKSNEQVQKEALLKLQNELQGSETRFNALKTHAETKLDSASEQLVKMRDDRAKEMAGLQTRMQKAEARTGTLEKENKELLAICDDLMRQLEQKNNSA